MRRTLTPLLLLVLGFVSQASAQFFNNRAVIQGYLKQGTTALNDATGYPMRFVVKRNSTVVWCQTSAANVPVSSGIFNVILSGNSNCQSLTNAFGGSMFSHTADSDVFVFDVIVDINKDGFGGADDASFAGIDIVSSPLAIYSNYANTALSANTATTATTANTATSATTATTAGNVSGIVALANGGTGASSASAARTNLGLGNLATINTSGNATHYLKGDGTWAVLPAAAVTSVAGKTGVVTLTSADVGGLGTAANMASSDFLQTSNNLSEVADAAAARGNLAAAASGANTDITSVSLTGSGTALAVTNNASIGGTLSVTGAVTANVTGNVTGIARQATAHVAPTTAGTTTAYTATNTVAIAAGPVSGTVVMVKINATNTGAATLNVDGTGAKSIFSARTGAAVAAGDLVANKFISMVYDGTNWVADIPPLPFTASSLNCGGNISSGVSAVCPNITAANVNAGDVVHCAPSADPSSTAGRVSWNALTSAGNISIRMGCHHSAICTLTSVNWKCLVFK